MEAETDRPALALVLNPLGGAAYWGRISQQGSVYHFLTHGTRGNLVLRVRAACGMEGASYFSERQQAGRRTLCQACIRKAAEQAEAVISAARRVA